MATRKELRDASRKTVVDRSSTRPEGREVDALAVEEMAKLVAWCRDTFERSTSRNQLSAYGLKACFGESPDGFYVYEEEFADAMRAAGFAPFEEKAGTKIKYYFHVRWVHWRKPRRLRPKWAQSL